jgi:hypothetical protein
MPANGFTNAQAAMTCSSQSEGIAVCSAPMAVCLARRYRQGSVIAAIDSAISMREFLHALSQEFHLLVEVTTTFARHQMNTQASLPP